MNILLLHHQLLVVRYLVTLHQPIVQTSDSLTAIVILELHRLKAIHLSSTLLNNLALLTHAQALEVFEADAHKRVEVTRMPAGSIHV